MFFSGGQSYPKNYVMTKIVDFCVKSVKMDSAEASAVLFSKSSSDAEEEEEGGERGEKETDEAPTKKGREASKKIAAKGGSSSGDTSDVATTVELYLFDCAGQSIFNQDSEPRALAHLNNTAATIVVYDVSSRESFKNCMRWIQKIRTHLDKKTILGALVANKIDLVEKEKMGGEDGDDDGAEAARDGSFVSRGEGRALAEEYGLAFFETSAKRAKGVDKPFKYVAQKFKREYDEYVRSIAMMHA